MAAVVGWDRRPDMQGTIRHGSLIWNRTISLMMLAAKRTVAVELTYESIPS
jgi:hypothetical protein